MGIVKQVLGYIFLPFKILFDFLDPILRFFEFAINIPITFILGGIVDIVNSIPYIWKIHVGELIIGISCGTIFYLLSDNVFDLDLRVFAKIMISILVAFAGYFIGYIILHYLINIVTSFVSLVTVLIRISIYLPGSIWMTIIKLSISLGCWALLVVNRLDDFKNDSSILFKYIIYLCLIMALISIIFIFIRSDVSFNDVGSLGDATLEELSAFRNSIGIYIMTFFGVPIYIGRAIEFKNGGLRKRLRDYQRGVNVHSSGVWIQEHIDDLNVYVLELGKTENDVPFVEEVETSLISSIYTKLNKVDASVNYFINIVGYILGALLFMISTSVLFNNLSLSTISIAYSFIILIISIALYFVENKNKWG